MTTELLVRVQLSMTDPFQAPTWVTLVTYWRTGTIKGGKQHELDRIEPTQMTVTFNDRAAFFRSWNETSPLFNRLTYDDSLPNWWTEVAISQGAGPMSVGSWTDVDLTPFPYATGGLQGMTKNLTGGSFTTHTQKYPVKAGVTYRARITYSAHTASVVLGLAWYKSTGALISTSTTSSSLVVAQAPATATTVELTFTATSSGAGSFIAYRAGFYRVDPGLLVTTQWGPGCQGQTAFPPRRPMRVVVTWKRGTGTYETFAEFAGYLTKATPDWPDELNADMVFTATDGLKILANTYLANNQLYMNTLVADGAVYVWRCGDQAGSTFAASAIVFDESGQPIPATSNRAQGATTPPTPLAPLRVVGGANFGVEQPIIWDPTTAVSLGVTGPTDVEKVQGGLNTTVSPPTGKGKVTVNSRSITPAIFDYVGPVTASTSPPWHPTAPCTITGVAADLGTFHGDLTFKVVVYDWTKTHSDYVSHTVATLTMTSARLPTWTIWPTVTLTPAIGATATPPTLVRVEITSTTATNADLIVYVELQAVEA